MKQFSLVCLFLLLSTNLFSTTGWTLVMPSSGVPSYSGISYSFSANACNGVPEDDGELRPNYTLPPTFYECAGPLDKKAFVRVCAPGTYFKPTTLQCVGLQDLNTTTAYPDFNWYEFLTNN